MNQQSLLLVAIVTILFAFLLPWTISHRPRPKMDSDGVSTNQYSPQSFNSRMTAVVPFVILQQPDWATLHRTVQAFRQESQAALQGLSRDLQVALATEQEYRQVLQESTESDSGTLADSLQNRIDRLSILLEHNAKLLGTLLQPFPTIRVLPSANREGQVGTVNSPNTNDTIDHTFSRAHTFPIPRGAAAFFESSSPQQPYDSGAQILAHIVRDWSDAGRPIQASLYDWCVEQVLAYRTRTPSLHPTVRQAKHDSTRPADRILVPGAGLGRLAWELAALPTQSGNNSAEHRAVYVEAVECSVSMAATAAMILPHTYRHEMDESVTTTPGGSNGWAAAHWTAYPYVVDAFSNEVDNERRYQAVHFPSVDQSEKVYETGVDVGAEPSDRYRRNRHLDSRNNLSYTIADFTTYRGLTETSGAYRFVVTCFFLDTATNVYDYVATIRHVLEGPSRDRDMALDDERCGDGDGGLWINVGPLQWHRNAVLHPSANELRSIVERMGFTILYWKVDAAPVEYRDEVVGTRGPKEEPRSTHYDAYCPLRFVARRN
jgi:hypothetical protein